MYWSTQFTTLPFSYFSVTISMAGTNSNILVLLHLFPSTGDPIPLILNPPFPCWSHQMPQGTHVPHPQQQYVEQTSTSELQLQIPPPKRLRSMPPQETQVQYPQYGYTQQQSAESVQTPSFIPPPHQQLLYHPSQPGRGSQPLVGDPLSAQQDIWTPHISHPSSSKP